MKALVKSGFINFCCFCKSEIWNMLGNQVDTWSLEADSALSAVGLKNHVLMTKPYISLK